MNMNNEFFSWIIKEPRNKPNLIFLQNVRMKYSVYQVYLFLNNLNF